MGLCKPADYNTSENNIYGILPYVAPEILRGQSYAKASDVYSFGIIMYEIISGLSPYHDVSHDKNLAIKICQGLRPRFNIKLPQLIIHLIKTCLDANPLNRPTAKTIKETLGQWYYMPSEELQKQIKEAEQINNNISTCIIPSTSLGISYKTHSGAIYTSRLLNYNNLPEPKNSYDYYDEQNDNIVSIKASASLSLHIDISQSKINDNNLFKSKTSDVCYEKNDSIININSSESHQINSPQLKIDDNNFPESKKFTNYYEPNDNINNMEPSVSLQIDISQLNFNEDGEDDRNSKSKGKEKI